MNVAAILLAAVLDLPPFGEVRVLDEVDCTKRDHAFREYPEGASRVETVLGRACRVMPVAAKEASFFKYRLGQGRGLKANGGYVVVLEYPDDVPRTYVLHNRSTNSRRSFATGRAMGDCWAPKYVDNHGECLAIPQSGAWERWTCYGSLTDRTPDWNENERDWTDAQGDVRKGKDGKPERIGVFNLPADGFDFVVSQYAREHDLNSAGVAVARILLCEIPDETRCQLKLALPPAPLPRRHLFWREEMSDGGPLQGGRERRHCLDQLDWIRHKARQMKMLGMNTYTKDLLEFGHVQHWDPDFIRPGWAWGADAETNGLWARIVDLIGGEYGFSILPYYEWNGNQGADFGGRKSYGLRKTCETLGGGKSYTHVWWTENANLDVTDPEALAATCELLDGSLLRFRTKADFAGALFRTRNSQWPVGFGDATRARFAREANGGRAVSRDDLRGDRALYDRYLAWWHLKRAEFLAKVQRHLADNGLPESVVILDAEPSESGPGIPGGGVLTDDKAYLSRICAAAGVKAPKAVTVEEADGLYLRGRREPAATWGEWEWQHAVPADDPENYAKAAHVYLAMPVNRLYSVADAKAHDAYRNGTGTETLIRHYSLNENMQEDAGGRRICGYAIADFERAGRASMQIEVEAMAKGDPVNIGYLTGSCFARGFPGPVREFNGNFLALPALPSKVVAGACDDPEVVLREIDCTRSGKGRYYALVHVGSTEKHGVRVRIPGRPRSVTFPHYGKSRPLTDGTLTLKTLRPWQLLAIHRD